VPAGVSVTSSSVQPADSTTNNSASAPSTSQDLPSTELTGADWRIECRVFKGNSEEDAAAPVYEIAFELVLKNPVTQIGRSSQKRNLHPEIACDWDDAVSHRHAKIEVDPEGNAFLVDLGSTNGTMVNGKLIAATTQTKLKDGDRISLGGKTALIVHGTQK
jgi:pSer/pThr/pTyr-binding forkhead associated (FHA) protein